MNLEGQHVAIAGAGIIGLTAALAFAEAGAQVTVFDSGAAMQQASWAAAGMLAVAAPENDARLLPLASLSRSLYPQFLARVEHLSGVAVPLRTTHTLQGVAADAHASSANAGALLAGLVHDRWRFRLIEEASLDPRDLCAALPLAARAAGVVLHEHTSVVNVECTSGARGVTIQIRADTHEAVIAADHFLLAAGAWSSQIACGPSVGTRLPIAPRKGQMIEVRLVAGELPVVLRTPELYLVPRGDGRVVIGATVEDAGFDRAVDAEAGSRLLRRAGELWPPILNSTMVAQWTGLRPGYGPGVHAGLPAIGDLAHGSTRLWAATGHFRNGILLAPGTARVLCALLAGVLPPIPVGDLDPARFTS